jgi:Methyltransferase TRM13
MRYLIIYDCAWLCEVLLAHDVKDVAGKSQLAAGRAAGDTLQNEEPQCGTRARLDGIAIATCCHHRCSWSAYTGKQLMSELGFSQRDFELLSWASGADTSFNAENM